MFVHQLGQDYYGPPAPQQSYEDYQKQMTNRAVISIGTGLVAASLLNPVVGVAAGVSAWLLTPGLAKKSKPKPQTQGG